MSNQDRFTYCLPAGRLTSAVNHLFKVKPIYVSLEAVLNLPPPQAITTYCFPSISYVAGVANAAAGNLYSHNNLPVRLLKARK